jgi:hypothetical protein
MLNNGATMSSRDILELIALDARSFHIAATDALGAFAEVISECAARINANDLTTLIAIGSVLYRAAGERSAPSGAGTRPRLVLVR